MARFFRLFAVIVMFLSPAVAERWGFYPALIMLFVASTAYGVLMYFQGYHDAQEDIKNLEY